GLRATITKLNSGASSRANYGLAFGMLTAPHWDALSPDRPLRYWRIVEPEPGGGLAQAALRIDERVLHFIAGVAATDCVLAGISRIVEAAARADDHDPALVRRIARPLSAEGADAAVVVLYGQDQEPALRRDIALAAARFLSRAALWIEARDLPTDPDSLVSVARHIDREVALSGCLPILAVESPGMDPVGLGLISRLRSSLVWLGTPNPQLAVLPEPRRLLRFEMPAPSRICAAQAGRWLRLASGGNDEDAALRAAIDCASRQFHLGPAALDSMLERIHAIDREQRAQAVWAAAREASRGGLDAIAQRIEAHTTFDDVILPPGQSAMLRDIARQVRLSDRVYRDWGFGAKHGRGQGLVALFAGESGTGKTLAAEAIANEAGLDLYRIDLATLVSKYIGETEKNLKRLFDAAETSGAVLLFDEADALFGKRSEVKDSHDRYANIEIAYLLQRVEAYRGLAILTTNMKSALDRAFMRRIRFVVSFPFPDAAARERIWHRQLPSGAPLGNIDFAALARLNLPGGNIRSVAVNAAFKAADANTPIDQAALMAAARAEFAKLERPLNDVEPRSIR
ncbi:MAG: ATP-binding protein, partial [Proteobacteria bacterium]|nr:ATP-binding protein [Pseudomonadota bacterium]